MRTVPPAAAAWLFFCASLCSASAPAGDHRAAFPRLPEAAEVVYLPARYAACLGCHPKDLVEEEDFNVNTNFRDTALGKNLHGLHVFRQPRGTNCTACHRLDGETEAIFFPPEAGVSFEEEGGSCAPACHRPKRYRNAGRPPSAP